MVAVYSPGRLVRRAPADVVVAVFLAVALITTHSPSEGLSVWEVLLGGVPLLVVSWVFLRLLVRRWPLETVTVPRSGVIAIGLFVWFIVTVVPALLTGVPAGLWARRFAAAAMFPIYLLVTIAVFDTRRQVRYGVGFLVLLGTVYVVVSLGSAGFSLAEFARNPQRYRSFAGGYFGPMAVVLAVGVVLSNEAGRLRQLAVLAVLVGLAGTLLSYTRTYWVATAVATMGMVALRIAHSEGRHVSLRTALSTVIPLGFVLGVIVVATGLGQVLLWRVRSIVSALNDRSFLDRVAELQGLLESAIADPIRLVIGHGFGAEFTFYSVNQFSWGGIGLVSISYSHNYFAYLLWSAGVVGVLVFIALLYELFTTGVGVLRADDDRLGGPALALLGLLMHVVVTSLLAPMLTSFKWGVILGFAFGLLVAASRLTAAETGGRT